MSPVIKHSRQVTGKEEADLSYVIGREEWNEGHIIDLGSARVFLGLDAAKDDVEAEEGNLYMAVDTRDFYYFDTSWQPVFYSVVRTQPPAGKKRILNFWWDPDTEEIGVEYEE